MRRRTTAAIRTFLCGSTNADPRDRIQEWTPSPCPPNCLRLPESQPAQPALRLAIDGWCPGMGALPLPAEPPEKIRTHWWIPPVYIPPAPTGRPCLAPRAHLTRPPPIAEAQRHTQPSSSDTRLPARYRAATDGATRRHPPRIVCQRGRHFIEGKVRAIAQTSCHSPFVSGEYVHPESP